MTRIIQDFVDTGADDSNGGIFNISPTGSRMLVYIPFYEANEDDITGVRYGGQPMRERVGVVRGSGSTWAIRTRIFTLGEAGIMAASNSRFTVEGSIDGRYSAIACLLQDVNQSNPIVDMGSDTDEGRGDVGPLLLKTGEEGLALAIAALDVVDDVAWDGLVEQIRLDSDTHAGSVGAVPTQGDDLSIDATTGSSGQQVMAAIAFRDVGDDDTSPPPPPPPPPAGGRSEFVPDGYIETFAENFDGGDLSMLIDTTPAGSLPDDEAVDRMNARNAGGAEQNYPPFFPSFLTFRVHYLAANSDTCYKTHEDDASGGANTPASQGVHPHVLTPQETMLVRAYDLDDFAGLTDGQYDSRHHIGGMLSLERFHSQRRGYWDCRARIKTLEQGHHASLWLLPIRPRFASSSATPEVDIVELIDSNLSTPDGGLQLFSYNNHGNSEWPLPPDDRGITFDFQSDPSWEGWHNFGFLWEADRLEWHLDGNIVKESSGWPNDDFEMYWLMTWESRVVPGDFPNQANGGTTWPAELEIDYVRIYRAP